MDVDWFELMAAVVILAGTLIARYYGWVSDEVVASVLSTLLAYFFGRAHTAKRMAGEVKRAGRRCGWAEREAKRTAGNFTAVFAMSVLAGSTVANPMLTFFLLMVGLGSLATAYLLR